MKQAGSSSPVELGFGARIICLQTVALKSRGLREATSRLFTSLTSVAGVGGLCGLRSIWTLVTGEKGAEDTGWRVRHQPPHPHQLTQFPRTALHGNRRKYSATLGCSSCSHLQKWKGPPTPRANLSSLPTQGRGLSIRKIRLPLPGGQGDGGWNRVGDQDIGAVPCKTSPARPAVAHFLLLQGLPACCLFQGAFPDSTPSGTPSCILDLLSCQSQVTLGSV